MTTNNHPAHGPVSLDRLHQISEILSKAAAQSDGGNLGYAMADAVKVIDGVLESIAREQVRCEHAAWSDETFGDVGPVGPLKHLSKEAIEAAAEPDEMSEWADMQFLLWDAQRRAGISDEQITQAMVEKLAVNKQREWPEPKDGEPRLHIKAPPAPVVPVVDADDNFYSWFGREWHENYQHNQYTTAAKQMLGVMAESAWNAGRCAAMLQAGNFREHHDELSTICSETYQVIGVMADALGAFNDPTVLKVMDNLSQQKLVHSDVLPFSLSTGNHTEQHLDMVDSGWIPVSDRIPDDTEFVLCIEKRAGYGTYGQPFVCWHDGDGWVGKTNYRPTVTHWMPLPAPPKQEVK